MTNDGPTITSLELEDRRFPPRAEFAAQANARAELYERAGNLDRAIVFYEKVGMASKVEELRGKTKATSPAEPGRSAAPAVSGGRGLEAEWRRKAALSDGSEAQRAELAGDAVEPAAVYDQAGNLLAIAAWQANRHCWQPVPEHDSRVSAQATGSGAHGQGVRHRLSGHSYR